MEYTALSAHSKTSWVLRIECLLVFFIAVIVYGQQRGNWLFFIIALLAIDISMVGYAVNNRIGGIVYNIGHSYIIPRVLLITALLGGLHELLLFALVWNAHISVDRAFGYGLKQKTFHHTHLGNIGKQPAPAGD